MEERFGQPGGQEQMKRTIFALAAFLGAVAPAAAQLAGASAATITTTTTTTTTTTSGGGATTPTFAPPIQQRLVEWDITPFGDLAPGSLSVDDRSSSRNSKVWFATRAGLTRLYRLTPGPNMYK